MITLMTFFSGTDMNTLGSIGNTMNHFLSLIVNNKGEYNARLTRKVKETMNCDVNATYKSFGDEDRKFNYKTSEDDEALEWIEASIEKMKPKKLSKDDKKLLDTRIASIDDEKERIRKERQNDLKQTRYVTPHWSWDDLDDIHDTHADIDNDFTWSWRSDLGKDMHKDIDANKFVYTLITGDMFPMNNVVNTNMNEVVSRALKVYNVKKRSITNALSCYGGIEMYVDHVMSYYGLFFDELEADDTANEILSSLSKYSVISDWVDELYQTLLSYEYYE